MKTIQLKRVYESYQESDGFRILVDRLWPRGIQKENAHIDLWLKDIAPSNELRKWFGHEVDKWDDFLKKYTGEINNNPEAAKQLLAAIQGQEKVTILFGAKDEEHNQALVIKKWIDKQK